LRLVARHGTLRLSMMVGGTVPVGRDTVTGRVVIERRTIHVEDIEAAAADFPLTVSRHIQAGSVARTVLATPLLREGTPLGVIFIVRGPEVHPFSAKQIALLETFADQAVIAIENVRLFTELGARNRELTEALEQQTATSEILRAISGSQADVQPVFDAIAGSTVWLCDSLFSGVFLFDGRQIELAAHHGFTAGEIEAEQRQWPRPATRDTMTGQAILDRRIIHARDVQSDPDVPASTREVARVVGYRSLISVPMLREGECIGSINAGRVSSAFTERQIALLQTFATRRSSRSRTSGCSMSCKRGTLSSRSRWSSRRRRARSCG
jgi:two-component system, NtrC family, sensor kinase